MHKNFKKSFENERKIECRSYATERQNIERERERRSKLPSERFAWAQAIFFSAPKLCNVHIMHFCIDLSNILWIEAIELKIWTMNGQGPSGFLKHRL